MDAKQSSATQKLDLERNEGLTSPREIQILGLPAKQTVSDQSVPESRMSPNGLCGFHFTFSFPP